MAANHQLHSVTLGDTPRSWADLGFAVDGPSGDTGSVGLGATRVVLTGSGDGFQGWSVDGVGGPIEDLPCLDTPSEVRALPEPTHPNGIASIDHIVVNSGDVERTTRTLVAQRIEVRGGRSTSSYGAPMVQVFFWLGDVILELVGPDEGEATADIRTSVFGLALVAPDLDATIATMGDLAGEPKDAVQPGRRIAGIRGRETGVSLPLAVMSPHPSL